MFWFQCMSSPPPTGSEVSRSDVHWCFVSAAVGAAAPPPSCSSCGVWTFRFGHTRTKVNFYIHSVQLGVRYERPPSSSMAWPSEDRLRDRCCVIGCSRCCHVTGSTRFSSKTRWRSKRSVGQRWLQRVPMLICPSHTFTRVPPVSERLDFVFTHLNTRQNKRRGEAQCSSASFIPK